MPDLYAIFSSGVSLGLMSVFMLSVSVISFLLFFFYFYLYVKLLKYKPKSYHSYFLFSIVALCNALFLLCFAILYNEDKNMAIHSFFNRFSILFATLLTTFIIHFFHILFENNKKIFILTLYFIDAIFTFFIFTNTRLFLYNEFFSTSNYYTGMYPGIVYKIWVYYMFIKMVLTVGVLIFETARNYKKIDYPRKNLVLIIISNIIWMFLGIFDALTSAQILNLPPLSWIGGCLVVIFISTILISYVEYLTIETSRLYNEIIHDHLTGCYSRGYYELQLDNSINELKRYGRPFSIIVVDADNFKGINDNYGHTWGDSVLKSIVNEIVASVRNIDVVSRYGGDEFVAILKNLNNECNDDIKKIVTRMKEKINDLVFNTRNESFKISCSFGVVIFRNKKHIEKLSKEEIFSKADSLLYASKSMGKNEINMTEI